MAFRFIIVKGKGKSQKRHETSWYEEPAPMTAPMVMSQVRAMFPSAAISIERENKADAKDAAQAAEDLKALKSSKEK